MNVNLRAMRDYRVSRISFGMVGENEINLDVMSLWIALQGYHHFSTEEEAAQIRAEGGRHFYRFGLSAEKYANAIKTLNDYGLVDSSGYEIKVPSAYKVSRPFREIKSEDLEAMGNLVKVFLPAESPAA